MGAHEYNEYFIEWDYYIYNSIHRKLSSIFLLNKTINYKVMNRYTFNVISSSFMHFVNKIKPIFKY